MTCLTSFLLLICYLLVRKSGSEAIILFFMLNSTGMKFRMLITTKIPTNEEVSCFKSLSSVFIMHVKSYITSGLIVFHANNKDAD